MVGQILGGSASMLRRVGLRTLVLLVLTFLAFGIQEALVHYGPDETMGFHHRFPEVMMILRALGILAWAETAVVWLRLAIQPFVDVQKSLEFLSWAKREDSYDQKACVMLYAVHQLTWLARLVIFLMLCDVFPTHLMASGVGG
jgi:hypothetical protein